MPSSSPPRASAFADRGTGFALLALALAGACSPRGAAPRRRRRGMASTVTKRSPPIMGPTAASTWVKVVPPFRIDADCAAPAGGSIHCDATPTMRAVSVERADNP